MRPVAGEPCLKAVQDDAEAELEAAVGRRRIDKFVVDCARMQAREVRSDRGDLFHDLPALLAGYLWSKSLYKRDPAPS